MDQFKTIFSCIAGSQLYGTNTPDSDTDIRGVFIPSQEYFYGFLHKVEQLEEGKDCVYYEIRKFFHLCLECNPNIIELLFVPKDRWVAYTSEWETIIENRNLFLSRKARYTFAGYAVAQLKRINTHRHWLLDPPEKQPSRSDFGLPNEAKMISKEDYNAINAMTENEFSTVAIDRNLFRVFQQEKAYQNASREWAQYEKWKIERNPARAALEAEYGYDTKHGMHLMRLLEEAQELLKTGMITLPCPKAKLLMDIRNGKYGYDELMAMVGDIDAGFDVLYAESSLPNKPAAEKADVLCQSLVKAHLLGRRIHPS